ncbi:MAG: RNA-guided endonuclease InsQ/TnpB family protein [Candidatus Ranarchaeia archaeon]|jgi:putative transposase
METMLVHRGYKTELRLNNRQLTYCKRHAGTARFVYNWGLHQKIKEYKARGRSPSASDLHRKLTILKKSTFAWMYQISKCAPQEALRNLDRAFANFFSGLKQGKKIGFPRFKSRHKQMDSFRLTGTIKVFDNAIQLPRLGLLQLKERGYLPTTGVHVLSATVSEKAGRWFISLLVREEITISPNRGEIVGVDLGVKRLATLSNGTTITNPQALVRKERKLQRVQRALARKKRGSRNRLKTRLILQIIHARIANVRRDALHKVTTMLTKTKSLIGIETLCISGMKYNHNIAKAISDVGIGEFSRQLKYKASWYGSTIVQANIFYPSSQLCSGCGYQYRDLVLSERTWTCPVCRKHHDRDVNAAINLRDFALNTRQTLLVAGSSPETLNACQRREVHDSSQVPVDEARIRQKT